jgi:uncharacterized membrane protein
MIFIPIAILTFVWLLLSLPLLFFLGYLNVLTAGFQQLGVSPEITLFILFCILIGSSVNIPLTKKKTYLSRESRFFGLFSKPVLRVNQVAINLGGAIIPIILSAYFIFQIYSQGYSLINLLISVVLMIAISHSYARVVPGRGILLPIFIPPLFSTLFSFFLMPNFAAPCAFVSGVFGTLIGADLMNLKKIMKTGGFLSIGGAGVFDGIFLTGIVAALISG